MDLITYIKANYSDVRVIGVANPSIIITHKEKTYTIYHAKGQKRNKYVICKGLDRFYFDQFNEIKKHIR
jgi:hypothetical protein